MSACPYCGRNACAVSHDGSEVCFPPEHKWPQVVGVKVRPFGSYEHLLQNGFIQGHAVRCSQCDCAYRLFYKPEPSLIEQSLLFQPFEDAVELSHAAGHPEDTLMRDNYVQ